MLLTVFKPSRLLSVSAAARRCHTPALSHLTAVSPVDGRYGSSVPELRGLLSEHALIRGRVIVEVKWLEHLADLDGVREVPKLSGEARDVLASVCSEFSLADSQEVKALERVTNHDVKAVEYFLRAKLKSNAELNRISGFIHFGCTSEDVNNLAYALMVKQAMDRVVKPQMLELVLDLVKMAQTHAGTPMLSFTHGQAATPTTLGKELANFAVRLATHYARTMAVPIAGKMNGAVGNFNAHAVAYPEIDWQAVSKNFIQSLGLSCSLYTTQIEPHDWIAELCHALCRFNTTALGFDRDMWGYISRGYFRQQVVSQEVGSSTMPHKVNPIDFENSEGNLGVANALLTHLSEKLPISRFQRDLSDSTVLRSFGTGLAHSVLAYKSTRKGLQRLKADPAAMASDLDNNWQVLTEPVQTVMRKHGYDNAYELLKDFSRGVAVDASGLVAFVDTLRIPEEDRGRLRALTPATYIGRAKDLAEATKDVVDAIICI